MITDPVTGNSSAEGASLWHVCLDSIRAAEWATRRQDQLAPPPALDQSHTVALGQCRNHPGDRVEDWRLGPPEIVEIRKRSA
jgi:hypothetical protein